MIELRFDPSSIRLKSGHFIRMLTVAANDINLF